MKETLAQLRDTLDQLQTQGRQINLFFRDDDVEEDEPTLRELLATFRRFAAPINLEIIPARLTPEAIRLLQDAYARQPELPELIELNQHGWQHVNHEPEGRKCEFGVSRSFEEQFTDIARGREVLQNAFGEAFSPVFTPPWNRCTEDTHRALDQLGFQVLSKLHGKQTVAGYNFRELSVTLDLFQWKNGATIKSPEQFIGELTAQLRELDTVGVMLHHKVMDESAFALIAELLNALRHSDAIRFHSFQSLLKAK